MRRPLMGPRNTYLARYCRTCLGPSEQGRLWTFQSFSQIASGSLMPGTAARASFANVARKIGETACTGARNLALMRCQRPSRCSAMPGTRQCTLRYRQ